MSLDFLVNVFIEVFSYIHMKEMIMLSNKEIWKQSYSTVVFGNKVHDCPYDIRTHIIDFCLFVCCSLSYS